MAFDREFFDNFNEKIKQYREAFWTGMVTVTIKAFDREFNVNRIISIDEHLVTFAHYENKKQRPLPKKIQEQRGEITAFPVISLPYSQIVWVELNPGMAEGSTKQAGFQQSESK